MEQDQSKIAELAAVRSTDLLDRVDYTPELLDQVEEDLKQHLMKTWHWCHRATWDITGDHRILFSHPIKTPSLKVYDNLGTLMDALRERLRSNVSDQRPLPPHPLNEKLCNPADNAGGAQVKDSNDKQP